MYETYIPQVSVPDILLDCHRWTGFLDAFVPLSGRQNMPEHEKIVHLLAAIYAYGCNCGPTQAGRALGISKNQVIYARRHYANIKCLMDAAHRLAEGYEQTSIAGRLGDPSVILTDSMQVRTLKDSLIARQHHRYRSGKSTLLYQHVTANCVCRFTQALLCNVSEAIRMLAGAIESRDGGKDPLINICDSAGKSDLIFGLSSLLNIELWPRIRSRSLKLWGTGDEQDYINIAAGIAGNIRWDLIEAGWKDMMWILASIEARQAKPVVIMERLASQPTHPATKGFMELGKLQRSIYLLDYGMNMETRRVVVPYTARREHWNKFTREVLAFGDFVKEKELEDQDEVFWFLTVVQNAIVLWNALALEEAIPAARRNGVQISDEDLEHILPTLTNHINFVGIFILSLARRPPFRFKKSALPVAKVLEREPASNEIC